MNKFGKLLVRMREKAGLSQKALADSAGVDASHLNRVERGLRNAPKPRTILALANALMLGTEDRLRLLEAAGYPISKTEKIPLTTVNNMPADKALLFASPIAGGTELDHPTIKLVADILSDKTISLSHRRQIAEQIASFAEWLRHNYIKCVNE